MHVYVSEAKSHLREAQPHGELMGAADQAYNKSGGNQKGFEKKLAQDVRIKKIADTEASAFSKSGLTRAEAMAVARLVSSCLPGRSMGTEETKKRARADLEAR